MIFHATHEKEGPSHVKSKVNMSFVFVFVFVFVFIPFLSGLHGHVCSCNATKSIKKKQGGGGKGQEDAAYEASGEQSSWCLVLSCLCYFCVSLFFVYPHFILVMIGILNPSP